MSPKQHRKLLNSSNTSFPQIKSLGETCGQSWHWQAKSCYSKRIIHLPMHLWNTKQKPFVLSPYQEGATTAFWAKGSKDHILEESKINLRGFVGFPGGSVSKESTCNAGDPGSIPKSRRFPGEGNGNPLQYSCLGNSMDRRAYSSESLTIVIYSSQGLKRVKHNLVTKPPPPPRTEIGCQENPGGHQW